MLQRRPGLAFTLSDARERLRLSDPPVPPIKPPDQPEPDEVPPIQDPPNPIPIPNDPPPPPLRA